MFWEYRIAKEEKYYIFNGERYQYFEYGVIELFTEFGDNGEKLYSWADTRNDVLIYRDDDDCHLFVAYKMIQDAFDKPVMLIQGEEITELSEYVNKISS